MLSAPLHAGSAEDTARASPDQGTPTNIRDKTSWLVMHMVCQMEKSLFYNNLLAGADFEFVKNSDSISVPDGGIVKTGQKRNVNQQVTARLLEGLKL